MARMISTPESLRQRWRTGGLVACVLALAIIAVSPGQAAGLQWPAITEPPTSQYVPGKWVWAELLTEDADAAAKFYGKIFGW